MTYTITVVDWAQFQHYTGARGNRWIKVYERLLSSDDYCALTFHQKGALTGIWLEYLRANGHRDAADARPITGDLAALSRRCGGRLTVATLERLNHAGFIHFSASRRIDDRARLDLEEEKELRAVGSKTNGTAPVDNSLEERRKAALRALMGDPLKGDVA